MSYCLTSNESIPERVVRIELELVTFTLRLTLQNGNCLTISDSIEVQNMLDDAKKLNDTLRKDAGSDSDKNSTADGGGLSVVEIKLDPINAVNTYNIPA
mmetsp:Transcript_25952/g.38430  ORF Transcript_25952/g.38430 Transcript_25952/m.38430 type:complete len:99 (-) Transcript_25952:334-630(-)